MRAASRFVGNGSVPSRKSERIVSQLLRRLQESSGSVRPQPEPSRTPQPLHLPSSATIHPEHSNIVYSVPSEWLVDLELVRSGAAMFPVKCAVFLSVRFELHFTTTTSNFTVLPYISSFLVKANSRQ